MRLFYGNLNSEDDIEKSNDNFLYLTARISNNDTFLWSIKVYSIFDNYDEVYFKFASGLAPINQLKFGSEIEVFKGSDKLGIIKIRN